MLECLVGLKSEYYEAEDRDSEKSFLKDGRGIIYPNDETLKGNLEKFFPFKGTFFLTYNNICILTKIHLYTFKIKFWKSENCLENIQLTWKKSCLKLCAMNSKIKHHYCISHYK